MPIVAPRCSLLVHTAFRPNRALLRPSRRATTKMSNKLPPPKLSSKDETSLTICWEQPPSSTSVSLIEGYKLRYRHESDPEWSPLSESLIKGTLVRKKNLQTNQSYYFSVLPVFAASAEDEATTKVWSWSSSSDKLVPGPSLSPFLTKLFPSTLVSKRGAVVSTATALGGKVIGIYFSASWCPPCRQYTPQVAEIYNEVKAQGKKFEIVFASCDHSESEFRTYFESHHPWLAIDYTDSVREEMMGKFSVKGIPRLVILKPSGEILVDNVGPISASSVDTWLKQCGL